MAKLLKADMTNLNIVKATIGTLKLMLEDKRIELKLREEYVDIYEELIKQLEFEEYCETGANSHKDV